jgi:thioredoxin 1
MSDTPDAPVGKKSSTAARVAIVVVVAAAVALAVYLKPRAPSPKTTPEIVDPEVAAVDAPSLPRIIEFGRGQCVACKMMKPVLDGLTNDFKGKLEVEVIDVSMVPEIAREFNVRLIPLQVFMGPDGEELHRHEGFYSREDILAKWTELGFDLDSESDGGA